MKIYKWQIGARKIILTTLSVIIAFVIPMFPQFFNMTLVEFIEKFVPIIKTASIAGLIIGLHNYLKIK